MSRMRRTGKLRAMGTANQVGLGFFVRLVAFPPEDTDGVPEPSQTSISTTQERGNPSERESRNGFRKRDTVLNGEGGFEPAEIREGVILILLPQRSQRGSLRLPHQRIERPKFPPLQRRRTQSRRRTRF
jgi:hypothetical protein